MTTPFKRVKGQAQQQVQQLFVNVADPADAELWTPEYVEAQASSMGNIIQAAQQIVGNLTNVSLGKKLDLEKLPAVEPALITARNGVTKAVEYQRPFWEVRKAVRDGLHPEVALERGQRRLTQLSSVDLQMAKVRQAQVTLRAAGRKTYRRETTSENPCALCEIAATQIYYTDELMPIHTGCSCDIVEDDESSDDPSDDASTGIMDQLTADRRDSLPDDPSAKDFQDLIAVRDHGEVGPTLTWKSDQFTGPRDLPQPAAKFVEPQASKQRQLETMQAQLAHEQKVGYGSHAGEGGPRTDFIKTSRDGGNHPLSLEQVAWRNDMETQRSREAAATRRELSGKVEPRYAPGHNVDSRWAAETDQWPYVKDQQPERISASKPSRKGGRQRSVEPYSGDISLPQWVAENGIGWPRTEFGSVSLEVENLDPAVQQEIFNSIKELTDYYPQVRLTRVWSTPEPGRAYYGYTAQANPRFWPEDPDLRNTKMWLNPKWFADVDALNEQTAIDEENFFHPPSGGRSAIHSTIAHEFGHAVVAQGSDQTKTRLTKELKSFALQDHPEWKDLSKDDLAGAWSNWLHENLPDYSLVKHRTASEWVLASADDRGGMDVQISSDGTKWRWVDGKVTYSLNKDEALAEAFADVECNGEKASEASKLMYEMMVDDSALPATGRRYSVAPGGHWSKPSPQAVVDAKEAKRIKGRAHPRGDEKFGSVLDRIPDGKSIEPVYKKDKHGNIRMSSKGEPMVDYDATWATVSDEELRENWRLALRACDQWAWEAGTVWYGDLNELCTNLANEWNDVFKARWGVELTPDLVAGAMSSYSTNNNWANNLVGVEKLCSDTSKLTLKDEIKQGVQLIAGEPSAMQFYSPDFGVKPLLEYLRTSQGSVADYYAINRSAPKPFNFLGSIQGKEDAATVDRWVARIMLHTNDYELADKLWSVNSAKRGRYGFERMRQAILDVAKEEEFAGLKGYQLQAIPWVHVVGGDAAAANLDIGELFTASQDEHPQTAVTKLLHDLAVARGWSK